MLAKTIANLLPEYTYKLCGLFSIKKQTSNIVDNNICLRCIPISASRGALGGAINVFRATYYCFLTEKKGMLSSHFFFV